MPQDLSSHRTTGSLLPERSTAKKTCKSPSHRRSPLLILGIMCVAQGCASMTSSGALAEDAIPRTLPTDEPGAAAPSQAITPSPSLITARTLIQDAAQ